MLASTSSADISYYTDEAGFQSSVTTPLTMESFENHAQHPNYPNVTVNKNAYQNSQLPYLPGYDPATDGEWSLEWSNLAGGLQLDFVNPVYAFGIDFVGLGWQGNTNPSSTLSATIIFEDFTFAQHAFYTD
ncbi:MAG: hypothetical protein NXI32_27590 [bacterium]|nr:hypothetical protein [bacterium]